MGAPAGVYGAAKIRKTIPVTTSPPSSDSPFPKPCSLVEPSAVVPDVPATLGTERLPQRAATGVRLETLAAVTHEGLAEITDGALWIQQAVSVPVGRRKTSGLLCSGKDEMP